MPGFVRIVFVAALAALPLVLNTYWINLLTLALIYSLAVYSINLLTGLTGLLSFGQAGFVGIGAYTYGVLSVAGLSSVIAAGAGMPSVVPSAAIARGLQNDSHLAVVRAGNTA